MEDTDRPSYEGDSHSQLETEWRQAYYQKAPSYFLSAIENRVQQHDNYLASLHTQQQLMTALRDERWEIRSAAVEALGTVQRQVALPLILEALHDENGFVRMSALKALSKLEEPIPVDDILSVAQDDDWQVREIAMLTFGELGNRTHESVLETGLHDPNSNVSDAAQRALRVLRDREQNLSATSVQHLPQPMGYQRGERKKARRPIQMRQSLQPASGTQDPLVRRPEIQNKRFRRLRLGLLLVATLLFAFVFIAAGTINAWWNPLFGDVNLYESIGQTQSNQGVTIIVTKVYADQGRTAIAYDIASAQANRRFLLGSYDVKSPTAQKQEVLTATQCDAPQNGVTHCYMLQPAFLVPAGVTTLALTLDVHQLVEAGKSNTALAGQWHFSFTVPFHHENRRDIPDPIHEGSYLR